MPDRSIRSAFWQGARDSLPFLIVVVPFGMIFGVLASEAGWTLAQTLGMSVLVIAGARSSPRCSSSTSRRRC